MCNLLYNAIVGCCCLLYLGLLSACENDKSEVNALAQRAEPAVETIRNVDIIYSDSAQVRIVLTAPVLLRYKTKDPYLEFTEGVKVTFYEKSQPSGELTARYGIRHEKERLTIVRDSVVWRDYNKKQTIFCEELNWDERKQLIFSDKFVNIVTDQETIYGKGFEAKQDFSRYKILETRGTFSVPDDKLK